MNHPVFRRLRMMPGMKAVVENGGRYFTEIDFEDWNPERPSEDVYDITS